MAGEKSRRMQDAGGDDEVVLQDYGERAAELTRKYGDLSCMKLFLEWKHCICKLSLS